MQHWIFSWPEGEQPTPKQADEAVRIFLAEIGLGQHETLYALHRGTQDWHLHVAVNRVHPETERVVTVNNGFDLEAAHRAVARIEHAQGWGREQRGRYQVQGGGELVRVEHDRAQSKEPSTQARDIENRSGEKSAQRIVIDEGAPIMHNATTWRELHGRLAEVGMRFAPKGSGAIVWLGETAVKASTAGRDCSMRALEQRLGTYEAAVPSLRPDERKPEALHQGAVGWHTYSQERRQHHADKRAENERLRERHRAEFRKMVEGQREERRRIFKRDWRGRGLALNAIRSLTAGEHANAKAALQQRQREERTELRERFQRCPDFEAWLRARGAPELAERWRHRERMPSVIRPGRQDADPQRPPATSATSAARRPAVRFCMDSRPG